MPHTYYQLLPPWVRRVVGILTRLSALAVLAWMLYVTYQQRDILFEALRLRPGYALPFVACYVLGFLAAAASWHKLLALLNARYTFIDDYAMYTYMSAYRHIPIPYSRFASLLYNYQQMGTGYRAIGVAIVITTVLHIVAGLLVFCGSLLSGMDLIPNNYIIIVLVAGACIASALHPRIFRRLVLLRGGSTNVEFPLITWRTSTLLVGLNLIVLLLGGTSLYFAALMIMEVPLSLLPVCIGTWGLMVSTLNMLSWLPADFGATRALFVLLLQGYMPIGLATAFFATFRVGLVVLDLINAGSMLLWRTWNAKRATVDPPTDEET
jgi:hypothetical protein